MKIAYYFGLKRDDPQVGLLYYRNAATNLAIMCEDYGKMANLGDEGVLRVETKSFKGSVRVNLTWIDGCVSHGVARKLPFVVTFGEAQALLRQMGEPRVVYFGKDN